MNVKYYLDNVKCYALNVRFAHVKCFAQQNIAVKLFIIFLPQRCRRQHFTCISTFNIADGLYLTFAVQIFNVNINVRLYSLFGFHCGE